MKLFRLSFNIIIFALMASSCDGLKNMSERLLEPSAREKYERQYTGAEALMAQWQQAFRDNAGNPLRVSDRFTATAQFTSENFYAAAFKIPVKQGDMLVLDVLSHTPATKIVIDAFTGVYSESSADSRLLEHGHWSRLIETSDTITVVIHPEIAFSGQLAFALYSQPSLGFPVAGKGNRDVQSFWGAARDQGARTHEGVDIFAKKGTPVVAASDGAISRTGHTGIGGKQVWLRSGTIERSLYYAHLDSIMVSDGQPVKKGDTLGTVGNTGNAAGGPPHLHFGIYSIGGAVDPYPYIRQRDQALPKTISISGTATVKAGSNLRTEPRTTSEIVATLDKNSTAYIMLATEDWLLVKTDGGKQGFVSKSRLQ